MSENDSRSSPNVRRYALGCLVAGVLACLGSGFFVHRRLVDRLEQGRMAAARVETEIRRQGSRPWHRPVLRGKSWPGNAAEEARRIVARLGPRTRSAGTNEVLDRALAAIRDGSTMPDLGSLLQDTDADRRALLRATQRSFAAHPMRRTPVPDDSDPLLGSLRAGKLVLVHTVLETPSQCMASAADVMRLAQDLSAGGPLIARMLADAQARRAAPILLQCAKRASADELATARAEIESLAAFSPPLAWTFEIEALLMAQTMTTVLPDTVWPSNGDEVEALSMLEPVTGAIDHQLAAAARWRARIPQGVTAALRGGEDEDRRHAAADNPLVSIAASSMARYARRAIRFEATLRALVLALDVLETSTRTGAALPARPTRLADPRLGDPLGDGPLRWTLEPGGRRATIGWTRSSESSPASDDELVVELPAPRTP